jgi:hypothetical protein
VGNCWLMAGMACLAEYPGAIQKAFLTREHNARGKYRIRLYDAKAGAPLPTPVRGKLG